MNTNLNLDKGNVLNYLLESERNNPLKVAYFSETMEYKYSKLLKDTMAIATGLIKKLGVSLRPILIYMEKSPFMLSAFWGSVMSRNFWYRVISPFSFGITIPVVINIALGFDVYISNEPGTR